MEHLKHNMPKVTGDSIIYKDVEDNVICISHLKLLIRPWNVKRIH